MLDGIRFVGAELVRASLCDPDGGCLSVRKDETMFFTGRGPRLDCLDDAAVKKLPAEVTTPEFTNNEELALHRFIYTNAECGAVIQCNRSSAITVSRDLEIKFMDVPGGASETPPFRVGIFENVCDFINSSDNLKASGAVILRGDKALAWGRDLSECLNILKLLEKASSCGYKAA